MPDAVAGFALVAPRRWTGSRDKLQRNRAVVLRLRFRTAGGDARSESYAANSRTQRSPCAANPIRSR